MNVTYIDGDNILITALLPWQEVVSDMNDAVKNASAGYASFNYEEHGYKEGNLVKVEVVVNNEVCDPLSFVCHSSQAASAGRAAAAKLKAALFPSEFRDRFASQGWDRRCWRENALLLIVKTSLPKVGKQSGVETLRERKNF